MDPVETKQDDEAAKIVPSAAAAARGGPTAAAQLAKPAAAATDALGSDVVGSGSGSQSAAVTSQVWGALHEGAHAAVLGALGRALTASAPLRAWLPSRTAPQLEALTHVLVLNWEAALRERQLVTKLDPYERQVRARGSTPRRLTRRRSTPRRLHAQVLPVPKAARFSLFTAHNSRPPSRREHFASYLPLCSAGTRAAHAAPAEARGAPGAAAARRQGGRGGGRGRRAAPVADDAAAAQG